jgi:hypothetical protein
MINDLIEILYDFLCCNLVICFIIILYSFWDYLANNKIHYYCLLKRSIVVFLLSLLLGNLIEYVYPDVVLNNTQFNQDKTNESRNSNKAQ